MIRLFFCVFMIIVSYGVPALRIKEFSRFVCVCFMLAFALLPVKGSPAQCVSYNVQVCIDGQSNLHIKGTQMWWENIDFNPPGTHPDCSNYGITIEVNDTTWAIWDSAYIISNTTCSTLTVDSITCYYQCTLLQAPNAANGWETIYNYNDDPAGGPHMYETTFTFCPNNDTSSPTSAFTVSSPVCAGAPSNIIYNGTGTAGDTYNWNFDGGTVISGSGQGPYTVSWPYPGTYPVTLNVAGCVNSGDTTTIAVSVSDLPSSAFKDSFNTPLCAGGSSTFISIGGDSANAMFNWNFGGGTLISGTGPGPYEVRWDSAGFYHISLGVSQSGCASSVTTSNVSISKMPVVMVLPTSASICWGDSIELTASGAISYAWSNPLGMILATSASTKLTPDSTTTYSVIGTDGSCSDTTQVTVQVSGPYLAVTIQAPGDTICDGQSTTLTITGSSGNIVWQSSLTPDSFSSVAGINDSSYFIQPSQTTYYRVVAGSGNCTDTSAEFKMIVNSIPDPVLVASDTLICASDSALIHTVDTYESYLWNTGDTLPYIYAYGAGGYWVTVTDANGCSVVSDHQELSVYPAPSVSIVVQGDTLASFDASTYQWYLDDTLIPGATLPVYVAHQSGDYAVQITDTNGCITISNNIQVVVSGIQNISDNDPLYIYPNPNLDGKWQLVVDERLLGCKLEVYNSSGQIVLQSKIYDRESEIALNSASGIYYLRIYSDKSLIVRKLVWL